MPFPDGGIAGAQVADDKDILVVEASGGAGIIEAAGYNHLAVNDHQLVVQLIQPFAVRDRIQFRPGSGYPFCRRPLLACHHTVQRAANLDGPGSGQADHDVVDT